MIHRRKLLGTSQPVTNAKRVCTEIISNTNFLTNKKNHMADTAKNDNSGTVILLSITTGLFAIGATVAGIAWMNDEKFIKEIKAAGAIDGAKIPTKWAKKWATYNTAA